MNNNRPKQNYFDQNIRQYGEDFLSRTPADAIQRAAKKRIFREMAMGEIDYTVYGKYFLDPKFFENLLQSAYDELNNNAIIKHALIEFDLRYPGNNLVKALKGKHTNLEFIYSIFYNRLLQVKQSGYNIGFLSDIAGVLRPYRNQL